MERFILGKRIEEALNAGNMMLDPNGHSAVDWQRHDGKYDFLIFGLGNDRLNADDLSVLLAMDTRVPLSEPVALRQERFHKCYICGDDLQFETNGRAIRPKTPCLYPDGNIPLTFELNVPSGVMVVANSLSPYFKILGSYDVNTKIGCVKTTKAMEQIGCAYAFVGNSCPGMYKTGDETFTIAVAGHDENYENFEPPGIPVASITTDLWWYSIVDEDEFKRRGCEETYGRIVDRVKVRPGVYRFVHRDMRRSYKESKQPFTFTTIEWLRPPDPIKDYLAEWKSRNFTAGQVIHHEIQRWPTLFNGPDAVQKLADHIFCAIGTGGHWHENGFVQYDPDMPPDTPEVEIPVFDKRYQWYPLSESSALCQAACGAIHLNLSFLALARNIIQCILQYGSESFTSENYDSRNREIAQKCFEGLNMNLVHATNANDGM